MLACLLCLGNNEDKLPKNAHGGNKAIVDLATVWLTWNTAADNFRVDLLARPKYSKLATYFSNIKNIPQTSSGKYTKPEQIPHFNKKQKGIWLDNRTRARA